MEDEAVTSAITFDIARVHFEIVGIGASQFRRIDAALVRFVFLQILQVFCDFETLQKSDKLLF